MSNISRNTEVRLLNSVDSANKVADKDPAGNYVINGSSATVNKPNNFLVSPRFTSATPLKLPFGYSNQFEGENLVSSGIIRVQAENFYSSEDETAGNSYAAIRVQAEDYVSAVDSTPADNQGGEYRNDFGVDIWPAGDTDGGFTIGATTLGENLTYTLNVPFTGTYNVVARIASNDAGPHVLGVIVDNVQVATLTFNGTGGWFTWATTGAIPVSLFAGTRELKLEIQSTQPYNVNWVEFRPDTYRTGSDTDIRPSQDLAGGFCVHNIEVDEVLRYRIPILSTGEYLFVARVATSQVSAQTISIAVDGVTEATLSFTDTGGASSWVFVSASNAIELQQGYREITLTCTAGSNFALNYFDLAPINDTLISKLPLLIDGAVRFNKINSKVEVRLAQSWVSFAPQSDINALQLLGNDLSFNASTLNGNTAVLKGTYDGIFAGDLTNINADKLGGYHANELLQLTGNQTITGAITFDTNANPVIGSTIVFPSGTTAQVTPGISTEGIIRSFTDSSDVTQQIRTITKIRPSQWASFVVTERNSDCFQNLLAAPGLGRFSRSELSGTTFNTTALNWLSDRWLYNIGGGCSCTFTRLKENPSQHPAYVLPSGDFNRFAINNNSGYFAIVQHTGIPAYSCLGKTFSYSFPARLVAGSGAIRVNLGLHKGVGNVAPVTQYLSTSNTIHTLTSSFARYSGTITIPASFMSGTSWTDENGLIFVVTFYYNGEGNGIGTQKTVDIGQLFLNYGSRSPHILTPDTYEATRAQYLKAYYATTVENFRTRQYAHSYVTGATGKIHLGATMRGSHYYNSNVIFTEGFNWASPVFYPSRDGGEFSVNSNGTFRTYGIAVGAGSWFDRELTTFI